MFMGSMFKKIQKPLAYAAPRPKILVQNRFQEFADDEPSMEVDIQELIKEKPEKRVKAKNVQKSGSVSMKANHVIEVKDENEIDDIIREMRV